MHLKRSFVAWELALSACTVSACTLLCSPWRPLHHLRMERRWRESGFHQVELQEEKAITPPLTHPNPPFSRQTPIEMRVVLRTFDFNFGDCIEPCSICKTRQYRLHFLLVVVSGPPHKARMKTNQINKYVFFLRCCVCVCVCAHKSCVF